MADHVRHLLAARIKIALEIAGYHHPFSHVVFGGHRCAADDFRREVLAPPLPHVDARSPASNAGSASDAPIGGVHDLLVLDGPEARAFTANGFTQSGFGAVAVLDFTEFADADALSVLKRTFDAGYLPLAPAELPGDRPDIPPVQASQKPEFGDVQVFIQSPLLKSASRLGLAARASLATVSMTTLGKNGRFANQLFQYHFHQALCAASWGSLRPAGLGWKRPVWSRRRAIAVTRAAGAALFCL